MNHLPKLAALLSPLALLCRTVFAGGSNLSTIHVDQPGIQINPMIIGLMTGEINYACVARDFVKEFPAFSSSVITLKTR